MRPAFRIVVDGEDRTAVIADRLLSLMVTDEDGSKADRVEIELDNRDGRIAFPELEARLEVSLGFCVNIHMGEKRFDTAKQLLCCCPCHVKANPDLLVNPHSGGAGNHEC